MSAAPTIAALSALRRDACRGVAHGYAAWLGLYFTDEFGCPLHVSRGQRAMVDDIQRVLNRTPGDAIRGLAAMCARGHGKSTLMKAAILYALVVKGFRYAVLLTAGTVYQQFSRDVRALVRGEGPLVRDASGNAAVCTDWDLRPSNEHPDKNERLWNVEDFKFYVGSWDRTAARRFAARGMTGGNANVRGLVSGADRPDLLWIDDPMKDIEAANLDVTARVKQFVRSSYWPCGGPDARYVTTGTPFNDSDLITEQITSPADWPGLLRRKLPGIHPVSGALYLPRYWTREKLEERKLLIGSRAFAEQVLLDPQGGGVRPFEPRWMLQWQTTLIPERVVDGKRTGVLRVLYTDPSLGRTSKSDYSAITVLDYDPSAETGYVRHSDIKRRRPQAIVSDHLDLWTAWTPDAHAIEDEGAQELALDIYERVAKERGLGDAAIPERQSAHGVAKVIRIKRLCPLVEFGRLRWDGNGEHRILRQQLGSWQGKLNGDEVDDGPDSLEGAWRLATQGVGMGAT